MQEIQLRIVNDDSDGEDTLWTFKCDNPHDFKSRLSDAIKEYSDERRDHLEENGALDMWGLFMECAYYDTAFWDIARKHGLHEGGAVWEYSAYRYDDPRNVEDDDA